MDGGPDTSVGPDAGVSVGDAAAAEASADVASEVSAPSCRPNLPGQPVWIPSTGYPSSLCTDAQVATIVNDCFTNPSPACAQDRTTYATCFHCLFTGANSAAWGPFVEFSYRTFINAAGCFAFEMGDSSSTSCAAARGQRDDCLWSSCANACFSVDAGGIDGGDVALYGACVNEALSGICASYEAALKTTCPANSAAYPICEGTSAMTKQQYEIELGEVYCANASADAGGD
jgi:hypothetical protein